MFIPGRPLVADTPPSTEQRRVVTGLGLIPWTGTSHTDLVQCAVRRPLPLLTWALIPVVFTMTVLGLTSLGQLMLGLPGETMLTSAHLGSTAGLTAMVGYSIEWRPRWRWIRWTYPITVFGVGIALHGLMVPAVIAIAGAVPSGWILLRVAWTHRMIARSRSRTPTTTVVSG